MRAPAASPRSWFRRTAARAGAKPHCRDRSTTRRSRASRCRGDGTASLLFCKAAPGTKPAMCSRCAPNSWRRGASPSNRWRALCCSRTSTTTASPVGASTAKGRSNMSMRKPLFALAAALALGTGAALAQNAGVPSPNLGKPLSEADIKAWDISVLPDGTNLPAGSRTSAQGAKIYAQKCVACHAEGRQGGWAPGAGPLVGGAPLANGIETAKTIANYYAYATTLFDYIRRAMPYNAPRSLADNEGYALTAYILALHKLIGGNHVMDSKTLPQGKVPNPDNFLLPYPH